MIPCVGNVTAIHFKAIANIIHKSTINAMPKPARTDAKAEI